jgi:hypothetical protein
MSDRSDRGRRGASCVPNEHSNVVSRAPFSIIVVANRHTPGEEVVEHRLSDEIWQEPLVRWSAEGNVDDIRFSVYCFCVISPPVLRYNSHNAQR